MIYLWDDKAPFQIGHNPEDRPSLIRYLVNEKQSVPAIVICPGGGYARRAQHEGEPIAKWLNSIGISAIILHYRVSPYQHPVPLTDVQRAIRYVRKHADEWNIDRRKIGVLGFSAGGHLASMAGTQFDEGDPEASDLIDRESSRPDVMVLCYPVISFGSYRHQGSMNLLIGENADEELRTSLSSEHRVTKVTPPTFIWHTSDDASVPVENSLLFALALRKHQIPFELHSFESGRHGLGLAGDHPQAFAWTTLCERWLKKNFEMD